MLFADRERSYTDSVDWYDMAVNTTNDDDSGEFDAAMDDPVYQLYAAMAQLYLTGGYGLDTDPSYAGNLNIHQPPSLTQPGHPSMGRRNEYQPVGGDAW